MVRNVVVFPAPFGPSRRDDLARVDVEREAAYDRHVPIAGDQAVELEGGGHGGGPPPATSRDPR